MNFDEYLAEWEKDKLRRREISAANLKQLLLDRTDISKITVTYDGSGDSGCFDDHKYLDGHGKDIDAVLLLDAVEEYVCSILPGGWEINEGSYGQVEIDIATFKSKVVHNERVLEEITTEFEV